MACQLIFIGMIFFAQSFAFQRVKLNGLAWRTRSVVHLSDNQFPTQISGQNFIFKKQGTFSEYRQMVKAHLPNALTLARVAAIPVFMLLFTLKKVRHNISCMYIPLFDMLLIDVAASFCIRSVCIQLSH
jgi:hypothetical protein